jgi:phospholipid/cholesterol/gamma-HCH transport system substrate-binding protein
METRANFVLIGAFTLAGILGALGFLLWLAKVEVDRQYAYYDILFETVSGLSEAGDVRYNGLPVGQVIRLALDREDPSKVRVRIEIDAATPVKTDTVATLELQGVTGVSYVDLTGGTPEAERLTAGPGERVPVIESRQSSIQSLFSGAPELLTQAIDLLEKLNTAVSPENQAAFGNILANLESASGELDKTLKDFSALSGDLSEAATTISEFTVKLEPVAESAVTTMGTADETLVAARRAIETAQSAITEATSALSSARQTFDVASKLMSEDLPTVLEQARSTAGTIETVVADIGGKAGGVADKVDRIGDLALARLDEAAATLARLDTAIDTASTTMRSIDATSQSIDTLVKGEATALVADTRSAVAAANQAIAAVNRVVSDDLPGIVEDVRAATRNVNAVVTTVGDDLTGISGKLDGIADNADTAIAAATETFRTANRTLEATTATMDAALQVIGTGEASLTTTLGNTDEALAAMTATLESAQGTLAGVDRLVNQDVSAIVGDIRGSVASLDTALSQVAEDLPAITAEVSRTLSRATALMNNLNAIVTNNSEEIDVFMQAGLPQLVRFVKEANLLVNNLQRLTAKIERDPARFLLGTQSPEFRR